MDAPPGTTTREVTLDELRLAARNHGLPLEALRHDLTPAGLHYLLIHYDIPVVDPAAWRLELGGAVQRPRSLSLDDLRARPALSRVVTLECAGNGRARMAPRPISQPWLTEAVGTAEWTGVPLRELLDEAGVRDDAVELVFRGLDRGIEGGEEQDYERSLSVADARSDDALLAYAMNGEPLLPQHGFPLRLVIAGWYGMAHVKWLGAITAVTEPFAGYQQATGYRMYAADGTAGEPVTRIQPRSLMVPPGIPDFMTRRRFVDGPCVLEGRAWSGWAPIASVEVSTDGGASWAQAALEPPRSERGWSRWTFAWDDPAPGERVLCSRATDGTGRTQPLETPWNLKGYANNEVERIAVTVR